MTRLAFPRRRRGTPAATSPTTTTTACRAPSVQLQFVPDGGVRVCGLNAVPLGNVATDRLIDLWNGPARRELEARLAVHDYSQGCRSCESAIAIEGRAGSYPELFETRVAGSALETEWPTSMEFNLSNSCNLQCMQCDGELSSSIRLHRERRSPLPKVYDDRFFEDLRAFIPHVRVAQFAGGEPFLAPENYRVWDLVAELNPTLECKVVTNATQWNDRIEQVLERVRIGFVVSIDGVTPTTFERIRTGARWPDVVENLDRFLRHARERGTSFSLNHCLMAQNYHEFGDLLMFAEERDVPVTVSVVRGPAHCAIGRLAPAELRAVSDHLDAQAERVRPHLRLNRATLDREVGRIRHWADCAAEGLDDLWSISRYASVLGLPGRGVGPHDDAAARPDVAAYADDGSAHWMTVGSDDIISAASPGMEVLLGLEAGTLPGTHVEGLRALVGARFGEWARTDVLAESTERIDSIAYCERASLRLAAVAVRDERGRALEGRLLIGVREAGAA